MTRRTTGLFVLIAAALVASCIVLAVVVLAGRSPATIPAAELAESPPIVFVWGERERTQYTASGDLYVVEADGRRLRRLRAWGTYGRNGRVYGVESVAWSPDRAHIGLRLTEWHDDPAFRLAVVSADGRTLRKLGPWEWSLSGSDWFPDGRRVVLSWHGELRVHALSTRRTQRIWRARPLNRFEDDRFPDIELAPDGRRIAAASYRRGIYVLAADGAEVARLAAGADLDPEWSPDGRVIAFTRSMGAYQSSQQLWTVSSDGAGPPRPLVRGYGARWSPDGRWIAFTSRGGVASLVSRAGGKVRRLSKGRVVDWSPDGKKILFIREADDPRVPHPWSELWVMDADGGRQTRLPFNRPRWSVLTADWRS